MQGSEDALGGPSTDESAPLIGRTSDNDVGKPDPNDSAGKGTGPSSFTHTLREYVGMISLTRYDRI